MIQVLKFVLMLSLCFLCDSLGTSPVVPGVNTNSQFLIKNKTITELAGGRNVSQECLLNGRSCSTGERTYLTHVQSYICMVKNTIACYRIRCKQILCSFM